MKKLILFLTPLALVCFVNSASAQANQSIYTNLGVKYCKTLRVETTGAGDYEGRCPGTAGYALILTEGDLRQNITVVTPKGAKHSLDLWTVVSGGFSSLGPKAEWRIAKEKSKSVPVGLILRYNASENPDKPDKTTSYLVVTKITATEVCVTDRLLPGPTVNTEARRLADAAGTKPCLKADQ